MGRKITNHDAVQSLVLSLMAIAWCVNCFAQVPVSVLLDNVRESADYAASMPVI